MSDTAVDMPAHRGRKPLWGGIADRSFGPPFNLLRGLGSKFLFYPLAESLEHRSVHPELAKLRAHYRQGRAERARLQQAALADMLSFAGTQVPYYRDVFAVQHFDPERVRRDPKWLGDLPILTKQIIAEQGDRLLSRPLVETRHVACKTGGSTGEKAMIYYDQQAVDRSAAVTLFARSAIGAGLFRTTLHFAADLPETPKERWPSREVMKCLAMNRSNIFFSSVGNTELDEIQRVLDRRRPYLVHGHPSTVYALACRQLDRVGPATAPTCFAVFESSGELLEARQRDTIVEAYGCRVIDRYGLAEFGVVAYQLGGDANLRLLESECWAESVPMADLDAARLVLTGLQNRLMPLIRYESGDLAKVEGDTGDQRLAGMLGRIHDVVQIGGKSYLTHHLQDVLDHRVDGIRDFQIDVRTAPPTLRVVLQPGADATAVAGRIQRFWADAISLSFVELDDLVRVGDRAKFRHIVS